jgi:hypothetical protein
MIGWAACAFKSFWAARLFPPAAQACFAAGRK